MEKLTKREAQLLDMLEEAIDCQAQLLDMLEEAIDCQIEEITEFCMKHNLSYEVHMEV